MPDPGEGVTTTYYEVGEFPDPVPDPFPEEGNLTFLGTSDPQTGRHPISLSWSSITGIEGPYECAPNGDCVKITQSEEQE